MARGLNGTSQRFRHTGSPMMTAFPKTLSVWVYPTSFTSPPYYFQFGNTSSATNRAGLSFTSGGNLEASYRDTTNTRTWQTTAAASTGAWCHTCAVLTSVSDIKAYLDGDSTGSYSSSATPSAFTANVLCLGALERTTVSNYLAGYLAEAAWWSVALTQDEVSALAAGVSPLLVRPGALLQYWPLDGRAGAGGDEIDWLGNTTLSQSNSPTIEGHPRALRSSGGIIVPASIAASVPTLSAATVSNITTTGARLSLTLS